MANKNSSYVQSLVSFILDTKPYHAKLTEIVEEYRFSDEMLVNIRDNLFSSVLTKAAWPYSHFADGNSVPSPITQIHRVLTPQFRGVTVNNQPNECRGAFKVGRDEITDLPLVPYAYDPMSIQGVGLADAFVQRYGYGTNNEALLEGKDVFLSHGAYVFQITQTKNTQNQYSPLLVERRNENLIATATSVVQSRALDKTKSNSAISRIQVILTAIASKLSAVNAPSAAAELAAVQAIVDGDNLPTSYENLISELKALFGNDPGSGIPGLSNWDDVENAFDALSPSIFFNSYTDLGVRETGALSYYDVLDRQDMNVSNIVPSTNRETYDELIIQGVGVNGFIVRGSHSGVIGAGTVPGTFTSPQVSFTASAAYSRTFSSSETFPKDITLPFSDTTLNVTGPAVQTDVDVIQVTGPGLVTASLPMEGVEFAITPRAKITVHAQAPNEAWSIIKVNPLAYSRPVLNSTRYGYIKDANNRAGHVTILDETFPTSTVILTAVDSASFTVTCTAIPSYSQTATVDQVFNDGRLQFTVCQGTAYTFQAGDKFYIEIANEAPNVSDLDLYFGYDMGPYDGGASYVYDAVNTAAADYLKTLDFGYDSRFIGYDASSFNLQVAQNAIGGRQWRLRAVPNLNRPLPQRAPSDSRADLTAGEGALLYDSDGNNIADIKLYYADKFALEYTDNQTSWSIVTIVDVGNTYTNATHGLTFTLVQPSKPFIGAVVTDSASVEAYGGDVILWTVENKPPVQTEPSGISSPRAPRLIVYGDSYHDSTPAIWTLNWMAQGQYALQGVHTAGPDHDHNVLDEAEVINFSDGMSYRNRKHGLHWTIVPGAVGLTNTDSFTFETFEEKPMFLVHGSVSGWQEPATIGKYYWNGKIGFKINPPDYALFEGDTKVEDGNTTFGTVAVEYLRHDVENTVYTLRAHNDDHWTLYRDGEVTDEGTSVLEDDFIRIAVPDTVTAGATLRIDVVGTEYDLTLGHDLAIVKTTPGRMPANTDFVVFKRTRSDDIKISIKAKDSVHAVALAELGPTTVDVRFVDHTTGSGVPLSVTSPEVSVLPGWIPALLTKHDSSTSIAEFSDAATTLVVRAATTGETIGTVKSVGPTPAEPVVFEWNSAFAAKYLPLNAEATIVTYGSGMSDRVKVNMKEGIAFLLSGGGLANDAMFNDDFHVHIDEDNQWQIKSMYEAAVGVGIADTGFTGFLPGYDNLPYDFEDAVDGYYDAGQALVDEFETARRLALKNVLTPQEQALLNDLKGRLQSYTLDPATMTTEQFIAALNAEPPVNYTPSLYGFGIPDVGMGLQVQQRDTESTSTRVTDAMVITAVDAGYTYDLYGYDVGEMDVYSDSTVILFSNSTPPIPNTGLPSGVAYEDFVTELYVPVANGRIVEVAFSNSISGMPQFYIWRPTDVAPRVVPVVEKVSARLFRFTLPAPAEFKLIVL